MTPSFSRALHRLPPARLAWVSGGLAFLVVTLCVGIFYALGIDHHQRNLSERVSNLASVAATVVDMERHSLLRSPGQTDGELHRELLEPLVAIHQRVPDIHYLYTMIYDGDRERFILDTAQDPRIGQRPDTLASAIGEEFTTDNPNDDEARAALRTGRPYVFAEPYADNYGRFISGMAPLFRPDGSLEGYLGVDLRIDEYERNVAHVRSIALLVLGIGGVCSVFLGTLSGSLRAHSQQQVAERAQAEAAARAAQAKAEQALHAKQELLSIAAHDLKNPLAAIMGVAEMTDICLQRVPPRYIPDATRKLFSKIPRYAHNMLRIIEEVLKADAVERIGMQVADAPFNASEAAAEVVEFNRFAAKKKGITIHYVCEKAFFVKGDRDRLMEALDNLVSNAVKYSPPGARVDVALGCDLRQTRLRFSVTDEGPGLSEQDQAKLFQKFQKLTAKPTAGESSTGLGLSIVKHIVEAHGGAVTCESEAGFGATFAVEIPIVEVRALYPEPDRESEPTPDAALELAGSAAKND